MLDTCENSSSISSGVGSEEGPEKSGNGAHSNGAHRASNGNGHRPNPFQKRPFLIGVAGGTSSGKSTVCSKIMEKLGIVDSTSPYLTHEKRVICISQDSFYRQLTEAEQASAVLGNYNFDHPSAFDAKRLTRTIRDILKGKMVKVPIYNYAENQIDTEEEVIYPADVVLVEGLLLFYFPEVRELFHMKIFVDTDMDTRLSRRVIRDVNHRKRDLNWVLDQYMKFVKPSFEEFCLPTKKYADIIVPRGPDNEVAIGLIVQTIRDILEQSTMAKANHQLEARSGRRPSKITHEHRHRTADQPFCSQPTTPISEPDFQERLGEFSTFHSGPEEEDNHSSGSDFEELFQRQRGFSFSGNSYSYS